MITTANANALAGATFPWDPTKHVTFVGRYLSKGNASLSAAEVARIHAAGLKVFSIQQHCNNAAAFFTAAIGTSPDRAVRLAPPGFGGAESSG